MDSIAAFVIRLPAKIPQGEAQVTLERFCLTIDIDDRQSNISYDDIAEIRTVFNNKTEYFEIILKPPQNNSWLFCSLHKDSNFYLFRQGLHKKLSNFSEEKIISYKSI